MGGDEMGNFSPVLMFLWQGRRSPSHSEEWRLLPKVTSRLCPEVPHLLAGFALRDELLSLILESKRAIYG